LVLNIVGEIITASVENTVNAASPPALAAG